MIPIPCRKNQYGFSLLEVLFAVIILAVALLATARLHAMVTRDGSFAKARGIAANLAQEKIDDLKAFTALYDPDPTAAPDVCGTGKFCYTEIGANTGGKEDPTSGVLDIKCAGAGCTANSSPFAIGNASYTRSWSVTNYYNCTAGSAASTSNCASPNTPKAYPDFKLVTVTVTWVDEQGLTQDVSMQTVIYASDPGSLSHMAASMGGVGPKVSYTPIGVPNGVPVPINTGSGKFKESSKPLPVISGSGDGIAVSFDSVTYSGSTGAYTKDSQDEFSTVGCECQFNSTNSGYTPTRKIWKGSALVVQEGTQVTKVAGEPLGNNPPSNCDICCRDHHDRSNNDAKYDPQRPGTDYETSGDHKHYWYSSCVSSGAGATNCTTNNKNASLASSTPLTAVTSGAYLESCRVMRHNGIWRVMQDWQLRKITILPYSYLTNSTNLSSYVTMVSEVVENAVKTDSGNSGVTISTLSGRNLTMTPGDAPIQLLSRAVYVDTIYNAQDDASTTSINEQNTVDAAYYTALVAKITASQGATPPNSDWMENVAFYEVNPTKLFDWTSSTPTIATVSSEEISAIVDPANNYYGNSSRGNVIIQSGTTSGTSTITVRGRLSNSGVTGGVNKSSASYVAGESYGTDDHDNSNAATDTITVTRSGTSSTTSHSVTGIVKAGNTGPVNLSEASSPITVTATSTTGSVTSACTAQTSDVDPNAWRYSCAVSAGWTGTLTFGSTGNVYTFESATSSTYSVSPSSGVTAAWNVPDVRAYGNTVTIIGIVNQDNHPNGSPSPDLTTTTITYSGTASSVTVNGTCSNILKGSGPNAYVEYTCTVPKGWTGSITVTVDPTGGSYTYLSPGSTPCTGASTSASCTMAPITALDNINGGSTSTNQTNVTARR